MKKTRITIILGVIGLCAGAQNANSVYEPTELTGAGYVVLNSGDTLKGDLLYWPHKNERMSILVNPADKKRKELTPGQIKSFTFAQTNRLFESLQGIGDNGKLKDSSFYERVNPVHLKFGVYKQFSSTGKIVGGKLEGWESFFISITGHLTITGLGYKALRPMNEKLATYVSDCPELQQKISTEQEGYKMPLVMGNDKKVAILKKIAEEYEGCGK